MSLIRLSFVFIILFSNLLAQDENLKIGILYKKIFSSKKEADVGISLWTKQAFLEKLVDKTEIFMYEDRQKLLSDFQKGNTPVLLSDANFYFKNKKNLDQFPIAKWIMSRTKNKFEQFYLIKNINTKEDFTNNDIATIYYKLDLAKIWIETLAYKKNKSQKKVLRKFKKVGKSKKLVYNAFFNKGIYSVVSKDLYDLMSELNPQIKEKTVIVEKSKPIFFRALGLTRKDLDKKFDDLTDKMINQINKEEKEFKTLSFFEVQKVYRLENKDLEELGKLYEVYFSMNEEQ